jgi:2-polyprenyl-3-methyl-5-hydroxy-6-metoxy-1,4-benzoquinol methylase
VPPQSEHADAATSRPQPPQSDALAQDAFALDAAAKATGRPLDDVRRILRAELSAPGSTVAAEIARRGIVPHAWDQALIDFYQESDAFVFELIGWNRQGFKRSMRGWSRRFLRAEADRLGRPLSVLCHGDGLGLDAVAFAQDGHRVTYFEYPGPSERFARLAFDHADVQVEIHTDEPGLAGPFDAVTSFDVLEHVPEPRETVSRLASLLHGDGLLLAHAPFYLILPNYPTHLAASRRHAGSTRLYERVGLNLVDGNTFWNPLAFRKGTDTGRASALRLARLRTVGLALKLGRHTSLPYRPIQALLRR